METKKTIKSMSDVADLFLALYAKSFDREDDKVYFSKDMKTLIESALNEVDEGLIEAAKSFGATKLQIIFKVIVKKQ